MDEPNFHKLPPSSSALIALSSLAPPSPVLRPTQLSLTYTSGNIPIFFDFDIEASPSVNKSDPTDPNFISPSSSSCTIGTVGTFGPSCRHLRPCKASPSCISLDQRGNLANCGSVFDPDALPKPEACYDQECLEPSIPFDSADKKTPQFSLVQTPKIPSFCTLPLDSVVHTVHAPPSASVREWDPVAPQTIPEMAPLIQSTESCPTEGDFGGGTSLAVTGLENTTRQMAVAAALVCLEFRCDSAPSSPKIRRTLLPRCDLQSPKPYLPRNLTWLDKTIVEMLIDQESFRRVLARFKFSGLINKQFLGSTIETYGTAQFRPTHRQAFLFHYALIDGPPVLRRITLNGEESRDYISRQASLCLKSNGVYVVQGTEMSSFQASRTDESGLGASRTGSEYMRLHWRFEYLVDDRRVDTSGNKVVDGEKIVTPLSFSCSPLLLHPLQGKRIRLMHVMKKAVAPKITAEKMEPPDLPFTDTSVMADPHAGVTNISAEKAKSPRVWGLRRAKSIFALRDDGGHKIPNTTAEKRLALTAGDSIIQSGVSLTRRRRASSAGEHCRPEIRLLSANKDYYHNSHDFSISGNPLPGRHIIPPARLAEMLEENLENMSSRVAQLPAPSVELFSFLPLSPNPRHHEMYFQPVAEKSR